MPECPEDWELSIQSAGKKNGCPDYKCFPPNVAGPISCPPPLCPLGFDIVLIPKKVS